MVGREKCNSNCSVLLVADVEICNVSPNAVHSVIKFLNVLSY